jgi:hypothetical protein
VHESRVIELFAKKTKRERLLFLAEKVARRADFIDALLHDTRSLERALLAPLDGSQADVAVIVKKLRATAKTSAHCISALAELDGRELPLGEALAACVGRQQDTLVFAIETERAYYENHEGERGVLAR